MTDAELRALLQLRCVPGLGDVGLGRLLREHGSACALLELPPSFIGPAADARAAPVSLRRVERMLRTIDELEVRVLALHQPGYPERLRCLHDAPVTLFARGDVRLLRGRSVAVVGTRRPTDYGVDVTEQLVSGLAREGVIVWSGAARGIDGVAHRTALDGGGPTVAVLGCGVDVAYPPEHAGLLEEIALSGLVLSEFLPGEPPLAHNFPRRNRILARGPEGVLVVEARKDGGALLTAGEATGYVSVMAVPGPIGRPTSYGPNQLIQDGAKLVLEVEDILEELGGPLNARAAAARPSAKRVWRARSEPPPTSADPDAAARASGSPRPLRVHTLAPGTLEPAHERVYRALAADSAHVDQIALRAGLDAARVLVCLLELELDGYAESGGGKRYRLPRRVPRPSPPQPAA